MSTQHQPDDTDFEEFRDTLIELARLLGVGMAIDPFRSPPSAREQIPMLAGIVTGALDTAAVSVATPLDNGPVAEWVTGYHYAATLEQQDSPHTAARCLGVASARTYLMWALYTALRRHHPYAGVAASLIQAAAQFSAIASSHLDPDEATDHNREHALEQHQHARALLQNTLDALDSALAQVHPDNTDTQP